MQKSKIKLSIVMFRFFLSSLQSHLFRVTLYIIAFYHSFNVVHFYQEAKKFLLLKNCRLWQFAFIKLGNYSCNIFIFTKNVKKFLFWIGYVSFLLTWKKIKWFRLRTSSKTTFNPVGFLMYFTIVSLNWSDSSGSELNITNITQHKIGTDETLKEDFSTNENNVDNEELVENAWCLKSREFHAHLQYCRVSQETW